MSSKNCVVCNRVKGRRVCMVRDNAMICPVCCAKLRNDDCLGCVFYKQAERYEHEKAMKKYDVPVTMSINQAVDDKVNEAMALAEQGRIFKSRLIIKKLLKTHPENHMVQFGMGVLLISKNKLNAALVYIEKAIQTFPHFSEAWYNKGVIHQKRYEFEAMLEAFQKVLEYSDPEEEIHQAAKGFLTDVEDKLKRESNRTISQLLREKKIFDAAYKKMRRGDYNRALQGFKKIISRAPDHTQSWGNTGICLAMLGRKAEALVAIDKALELDPAYEPAKTNRAAIEKMKEGKPLVHDNFGSVDYYRELFQKGKAR